jgi:hypothetical protein
MLTTPGVGTSTSSTSTLSTTTTTSQAMETNTDTPTLDARSSDLVDDAKSSSPTSDATDITDSSSSAALVPGLSASPPTYAAVAAAAANLIQDPMPLQRTATRGAGGPKLNTKNSSEIARERLLQDVDPRVLNIASLTSRIDATDLDETTIHKLQKLGELYYLLFIESNNAYEAQISTLLANLEQTLVNEEHLATIVVAAACSALQSQERLKFMTQNLTWQENDYFAIVREDTGNFLNADFQEGLVRIFLNKLQQGLDVSTAICQALDLSIFTDDPQAAIAHIVPPGILDLTGTPVSSQQEDDLNELNQIAADFCLSLAQENVWQNILASLKQQQIDVEANTYFLNCLRKTSRNFSNPYFIRRFTDKFKELFASTNDGSSALNEALSDTVYELYDEAIEFDCEAHARDLTSIRNELNSLASFVEPEDQQVYESAKLAATEFNNTLEIMQTLLSAKAANEAEDDALIEAIVRQSLALNNGIEHLNNVCEQTASQIHSSFKIKQAERLSFARNNLKQYESFAEEFTNLQARTDLAAVNIWNDLIKAAYNLALAMTNKSASKEHPFSLLALDEQFKSALEAAREVQQAAPKDDPEQQNADHIEASQNEVMANSDSEDELAVADATPIASGSPILPARSNTPIPAFGILIRDADADARLVPAPVTAQFRSPSAP